MLCRKILVMIILQQNVKSNISYIIFYTLNATNIKVRWYSMCVNYSVFLQSIFKREIYYLKRKTY